MPRKYSYLSALFLFLAVPLLAQLGATTPDSNPMLMVASNVAATTTLAPEMALRKYYAHSQDQSYRLRSYESETVVHAELLDTAQQGEYELIASYTAVPRSLSYSSVHFEGDRFVKSNVILKLLQSEVDHVRKGDDGATAIVGQNYKFSYKGVVQVKDHPAHVFHLKPRHKTAGLFKGQIFLDANTGSMLRMEGAIVKSPSFFVRDISFVQDFEDIDGFTLPTQLRTYSRARIVGRTIVNVIHRSYKLHADSAPAEPVTASSDSGSN